MELQTTSSLDLKVTKEDLIDIVINEKLTLLEEERDVLLKKLKVFQDKSDDIRYKSKNRLHARLMKSLPGEIVTEEVPKLNYHSGYNSTQVAFIFDKFNVIIQEVNTIDPKFKDVDKDLNKVEEDKRPIITELDDIDNKIKTLEGNNKRLKSQMLKTFLTKTDEGRAILGILGEKSTKLLK